MGDFVAAILRTELRKGASKTRPAFVYRDKGSMATVGLARAVADVWGRTYGGLPAWLLWSFIHVMFLVSFRNRFFVMLHWCYNYLARSSGVRLITGDVEPKVISGTVKHQRPEPLQSAPLQPAPSPSAPDPASPSVGSRRLAG
jgi:NADH dehydrogenase